MAHRSPQSQTTHDTVIAARNRAWQGGSRHLQTWTNPDGEHNANYKLDGVEQYPDLIIKLAISGRDQFGIEEVETDDSVNTNEVQQWRDYSALPQKTWFNLVVPMASVPEARKLAKGLALNVVGYSRDANGSYSFAEGEPANK